MKVPSFVLAAAALAVLSPLSAMATVHRLSHQEMAGIRAGYNPTGSCQPASDCNGGPNKTANCGTPPDDCGSAICADSYSSAGQNEPCSGSDGLGCDGGIGSPCWNETISNCGTQTTTVLGHTTTTCVCVAGNPSSGGTTSTCEPDDE